MEYFFLIVRKVNIFLQFSLFLSIEFFSIFILYFLSIYNCTFRDLGSDTCSTITVTVIFSETVTVVFFSVTGVEKKITVTVTALQISFPRNGENNFFNFYVFDIFFDNEYNSYFIFCIYTA